MKRVNVNISSSRGLMPFYIEYSDEHYADSSHEYYYAKQLGKNNIIMFGEGVNVIRNENIWSAVDVSDLDGFILNNSRLDIDGTTIPELNFSPKVSKFKLYIPKFSPQRFHKGILYALDLSIKIHGVNVVLGSYVINPLDCIALPKIVNISNNEYYEYIPLNVLDPWDIVYSDTWKTFRQQVCGEETNDGDYEYNNTGSNLNISLHVIDVLDGDKDVVELVADNYVEHSSYFGGQNTICISKNNADYLDLFIKPDLSSREDNTGMHLRTSVTYNGIYNDNVSGFKEYLQETYGITDDFTMELSIFIQDDDNLYAFATKEINSPWNDIDMFSITDSNDNKLFKFDSWDNFKIGMYLKAILRIDLSNQVDTDASLYLHSNKIFLTHDLFKYLVCREDEEDDSQPLLQINIDDIDMNVYNIKAINKIEQKIVQVERPDDYKANIIKPVFYKSQTLGSIILHRGTNENICINLDSYKSKVSAFVLKVGGINFAEYARTTAGVIFAISSSDVSNVTSSYGTYYIQDTKGNLITTGQYSVV